MDIRAYAAADREGCLAVLESLGGEELVDFAAYLDGGPRYFVAEHDGRIVGCGGVGEGRLEWGMVHGAMQRQGLGRFLLYYRMRVVGKLGNFEHVHVRVPRGVAGFYAGQGFREVGGDAGWAVMSKRLAVCG